MASDTPPPDLTTLYTPGQLDVLRELGAIQEQLGLSDAQFVQRHLTVSASSWHRLKAGTYKADPASALLKLETNLRQLRIESAQRAKLTGNRPFYPLAQQQAVIDAVTTCKLKPADDPNRFIAYLAETGGGKTALARQLKIMHDGILVEGRESWRKSYYAALIDIASEAGVAQDDMGRGERGAENALLRRFRGNKRVLILDEGEYFGPRTINLVKLLLNQTPTVVVVMAIPSLFNKWQKAAWEEAKQINRRAEAMIDLGKITPDEVAIFVKARCKVAGNGQGIFGAIAKTANEFGGFDMVTRVVDELAKLEGEAVGVEETTHAIHCVKRLLNRNGGAS